MQSLRKLKKDNQLKKNSKHTAHVYEFYVNKNKAHICVFNVKDMHFMDIGRKAHKYISFIFV